MKRTQHFKLKNGAQLLVSPEKDTASVTILIMFKVGSRYETPDINGSSHFIEHLMFKGTSKRPTTLDISKELDGVGADYNAFTSKDTTGYYVKVDAKQLPLATDILQDMLFNSLFDSKEIDRERGVIIEEINMYEDNPLMHAEELLEELLFGAKHPLGYQIAGPRSVIRNVTRQKLLTYKEKFYDAKHMVVSVAGKVTAKDIQNLKRTFSGYPTKPGKHQFIPFRGRQTSSRALLKHKKTEQVQMVLGVPAGSLFDKDLAAMSVLSVILGGNMSSRLFVNVREKRGLCYMIRSSVNPYEDVGSFTIQSGIARKSVSQALEAILGELKRLKIEPVKAQELKQAKDFISGKLTLSWEDSETIANYWARQFLLEHKLETPDEKLRRIQKVSVNDIQRVAKKLFKTSQLNLVLIGPYSSAAPFKRLLKV